MIVSWYQKYIDYIDLAIEKLSLRLNENKKIEDTNVLLEMIEQIDPSHFDSFINKSKTLSYINTPYKTIDEWISKLKEVNSYLQTDKVIYSHWSNETSKEILSTSFMLSVENFYIDEKLFVEEFKSRAKIYAIILEKCSHFQIGPSAHNTRVLTHFTRCLEATANSLLCIQQH